MNCPGVDLENVMLLRSPEDANKIGLFSALHQQFDLHLILIKQKERKTLAKLFNKPK